MELGAGCKKEDEIMSKNSNRRAPAKKSASAKARGKNASRKIATRNMTLEGYKGMHRKGSRKSDVHACFDAKGFDAALTLAKKKGIKDGSARRWLSSWGGRKAAGGKKAKAA